MHNRIKTKSFNVTEARSILKARAAVQGETKKILGLLTPQGKSIALHLDTTSRVQVWIEYEEGVAPRELGLIAHNRSNPGMPYCPGQTRNSNLNTVTAPRLAKDKAVWLLEVPSKAHLNDLLDLYSG